MVASVLAEKLQLKSRIFICDMNTVKKKGDTVSECGVWGKGKCPAEEGRS